MRHCFSSTIGTKIPGTGHPQISGNFPRSTCFIFTLPGSLCPLILRLASFAPLTEYNGSSVPDLFQGLSNNGPPLGPSVGNLIRFFARERHVNGALWMSLEVSSDVLWIAICLRGLDVVG